MGSASIHQAAAAIAEPVETVVQAIKSAHSERAPTGAHKAWLNADLDASTLVPIRTIAAAAATSAVAETTAAKVSA